MKLKRSRTPLAAVAHHEAGHAIAAWRLERRVFSVTIEPEESIGGSVIHKNPLHGLNIGHFGDDSPRERRRAENSMLIALSGPAAQRKYNRRTVRHYHGASDRKHVYELLIHLCGSDSGFIRAYYRVMEARARALIQHHVNWRAIQILSEELLRERTLSGKTLRDVIIGRCFALPLRARSEPP
jgi:hypothetical protein